MGGMLELMNEEVWISHWLPRSKAEQIPGIKDHVGCRKGAPKVRRDKEIPSYPIGAYRKFVGKKGPGFDFFLAYREGGRRGPGGKYFYEKELRQKIYHRIIAAFSSRGC